MKSRNSSNSRYSVVAAVLVLAASSQLRGQLCGNWAVTPNPLFQGVEARPTLIVPFSSSNAVALLPTNVNGEPTIAHIQWGGSSWTVAATPSVGDLLTPTGWQIRAVTGSDPNDLWATGLAGLDNFHGVPFLAHYDGVEWTSELGTIFEDPNPDAGDPIRTAEGSALVVFAPNDIWVFGSGEDLEQWVSNPVACHWDGSNLTETGTIQPMYSRSNRFEDGDGSNPNSVWIVGYGKNVAGNYHLLTHHWDGSQWTLISDWTALPGQNIVQDFLYDVVAFAPNDVWAFGKKTVLIGGNTATESFYVHWDGSGWTEIAAPDIGPITSAAGAAPDDIWVSCAYGEFGGRMAHWDGVNWTEVQTAPIPGATHIGLTNLVAGAGCNAWAVGYWAIYDGMGGWEEYVDIIEQLAAPVTNTPGDIDGNGLVDMGDAVILADVLMGIDSHPARMSSSDLNGDGAADGLDVAAFIAVMLGD